MQTEMLLQQLVEQTRQVINRAQQLRSYPTEALTWRATPGSWNILECLEHLNLYGNYYLPALQKSIASGTSSAEGEYKPGWLGNYFATMMLPGKKVKKMKTFKSNNPLHKPLDRGVIDRFIAQQITLLQLLDQSRKVSLNRERVATSICPLITLTLGDTFRFLVNHILRHLQQADAVQDAIRNNPSVSHLLRSQVTLA